MQGGPTPRRLTQSLRPSPQTLRRMDGGTLSEEEIERLGLALLKLNERMEELKTTFGLTDEDLNIDLGPLGRLR